MKILLLGGGGREHAISWLLSKSPLCEKLFIAPGNAGTASLGVNVAVDALKFDDVKQFVLDQKIDFVIVGPEDPAVKGIADYFEKDIKLTDVRILAPSGKGAQLEGSKEFAKIFMQKYGIPTASYRSFVSDQYKEAKEYIQNHPLPVVVKADGLAAGKGVVVCFKREEALSAIENMFVLNKFGKAGEKVVIEDFLEGIEMSAFVLTDGEKYVLLPEAKDYKRIGEGDTGPNTGGMGCISPVPFADDVFMNKVIKRVIEPTVSGLNKENIDYRGFIFFGLMNVAGDPYVIEYNVRLGDPESEVILPRLDEDILPFMFEAASGNLSKTSIRIKKDYAVTVMAVSAGYPGDYEKGKEISGLDKISDSLVFHAGTKISENKIITSGGRVLCVTSLGPDLKAALEKTYKELDKIHFENKAFRKDIGMDLLKYLMG
jgi:phosphoribosylamine---glycine ligase